MPATLSIETNKDNKRWPTCATSEWVGLRAFWDDPIDGIILGKTYDATICVIGENQTEYHSVVLAGEMDTTGETGPYYLLFWVPRDSYSEEFKLEMTTTPRLVNMSLRQFEKEAPKTISVK